MSLTPPNVRVCRDVSNPPFPRDPYVINELPLSQAALDICREGNPLRYGYSQKLKITSSLQLNKEMLVICGHRPSRAAVPRGIYTIIYIHGLTGEICFEIMSVSVSDTANF